MSLCLELSVEKYIIYSNIHKVQDAKTLDQSPKNSG